MRLPRHDELHEQPALASPRLGRRAILVAGLGAIATFLSSGIARAQVSGLSFAQWVERFRPRARARGISEATYARVMGGIRPDTSVYALQRAQPEFQEPMWQYINRRAHDRRIITGKSRGPEPQEY